MFTGEVYDYLGIRFFVTSQAKYLVDAGAGNVDVYFTLIIGRDAFGVAGLGQTRPQMQLGMGGTGNPVMPVSIINKPLGYADELDLRASTGWKMTQEEKELDPTFCIRIEHACSLGSN
jgi:N4-gp56 family major capsid protein